MNAEELFLANLPLIDRIVGATCRHHHASPEERDEFASKVTLKLIEEDYAVFRKFQGRSSLATYLTSVIQRLFLDHRNHCWGKWRPSAEARRLGPVALMLERLVSRDGHTLDEAYQLLKVARGVALSQDALELLASRLPMRTKRVHISDEQLVSFAAPNAMADQGMIEEEKEHMRTGLVTAMAEALEGLSPEDRLIIKLRTEDGLPIVDIAALLSLEARPLYRRLESLLKELRNRLERQGIRAEMITEAFEEMPDRSSLRVTA